MGIIMRERGFRKKRRTWIKSGVGDIEMGVNLQKSQFGNRFYVNVGYIVKSQFTSYSVAHWHAFYRLHELGGIGDKSRMSRLRKKMNFPLLADEIRKGDIVRSVLGNETEMSQQQWLCAIRLLIEEFIDPIIPKRFSKDELVEFQDSGLLSTIICDVRELP